MGPTLRDAAARRQRVPLCPARGHPGLVCSLPRHASTGGAEPSCWNRVGTPTARRLLTVRQGGAHMSHLPDTLLDIPAPRGTSAPVSQWFTARPPPRRPRRRDPDGGGRRALARDGRGPGRHPAHRDDRVRHPDDHGQAEQRLRGHALPRLPGLRGARAVGPDRARTSWPTSGPAWPSDGSRTRATTRSGSSTCARA